MKLPTLVGQQSVQKQVLEFKGYNHNSVIVDGEFYDMQNLSSRLYPLLSPRKPRGTELQLTKPNGLTDKNGLVYVDGTDFYYNGVKKGTVSDSPKQFASMGAYIIIFPDKICFNTTDDTLTPLEAYFTTTNTVSINGCTMDGTITDPASSLYIKISVAGIDDNFKRYDGVTITSSIAVLNKTSVITNIGTDYIIIPGKIGYNQTCAGISVERTVPDIEFITESENRLWGCSSEKHEIYASKLGDPYNWNCFEGISTDSYAVTVGSDGDFTGAITYLGYVLFFKEDCVHKVYGSKPANYQVFENSIRGVAKGSEKSLAIVNETLFYMSRNGVVAYEGSLPENISYAFGDKTYSNGVSGAIGDKYYISVQDGAAYHLFVYDTKLGMWHREDNTKVSYFTEYGGKLYYIDGITKKLRTTEGADTDIIVWSAEFSDYAEKSFNKKYVSKLQLKIELEEDSIFEIDIQYDDSGIWEKITTLSGKTKKGQLVPVRIRRCDYYKIRLSGAGQFKLYGIVKTYTEGSGL
jgi:hypothetical protein